MLSKTKTALAAALVAGSASTALAQGFDPNMANRYPAYANPVASASRSAAAPRETFRSAPVQLRQSRNVALPTSRIDNYSGRPSQFEIDRNDHASSPYAGGGF